MTSIPEAAQRARQMYAEKALIGDILDATGLTKRTLYRWLDGGPIHEGERPLPPVPRRKQGARPERILKDERVHLIARLMTGAQTLVREIELRLAKGGTTPKDNADDSRSFAALTRTLRELTALDALNDRDAPQSGPQQNDEPDDDEVPRDIEEFRRELARRINAFVDEQEGRHGGVSGDAAVDVD